MHIHNQNRLASSPRLRKSIQIGKIQPRIPMRKPKVRPRIMVRHNSPPSALRTVGISPAPLPIVGRLVRANCLFRVLDATQEAVYFDVETPAISEAFRKITGSTFDKISSSDGRANPPRNFRIHG